MHDARDAEDQRKLEAGEYVALVESYYGVMLDRSRVKVRRGGRRGQQGSRVTLDCVLGETRTILGALQFCSARSSLELTFEERGRDRSGID